MILMRTKMVTLSITLVTLMTVTSQKRISHRRLSDVVLIHPNLNQYSFLR